MSIPTLKPVLLFARVSNRSGCILDSEIGFVAEFDNITDAQAAVSGIQNKIGPYDIVQTMPSGSSVTVDSIIAALQTANLDQRLQLNTTWNDSWLWGATISGFNWQALVENPAGVWQVVGHVEWPVTVIAAHIRYERKTTDEVLAMYPGMTRNQLLACILAADTYYPSN